MIKIHNATTGEIVEREMNDEELQDYNDQLAKLAKAPTPQSAPVPTGNPLDAMMGSFTPLDAEYNGDLPISDGVAIGRGRDESALPARLTSPINQSQDLDLIKKYLPDLLQATRLPGAPDSYKELVNYLKAQIL